VTEIDLARWLFTAFFVLLAVAPFFLPRRYILRGAPSRAAWRDLRWWALLLVAIHVAVYWWF